MPLLWAYVHFIYFRTPRFVEEDYGDIVIPAPQFAQLENMIACVRAGNTEESMLKN